MTDLPPPRYIDISRPLDADLPVWPGDPPFEIEWASRISRGDGVNLAVIRTGVHAGTHVDSPYHVLGDGPRIDDFSPEVFIGPARVVDVRGRDSIHGGFVQGLLGEAERPVRLLLRTGAWQSSNHFPSSYPCLTTDAAAFIASAGVRLLGTDAPSVDPLDSSDLPIHKELLSSGMCILENLLLDEVAPGEYDLVALPLRLRGADASPVRAVLRRR